MKIIEQLNLEFSEIVARVSKSVVSISGRRTVASGIAWTTDLIIAPAHSLHRGAEYELITSDGETLAATVAGRDPSVDIAILKSKTSLPEVEKSLNEPLQSGELAISLGRARGGRLLSVLTMLSISDTAYRNWRGGTFDRFIRLDIFPFPGFSGSALVLANG
ncbi:MAG TPA: serine protease, partial [Acidobacteriota bacterium]